MSGEDIGNIIAAICAAVSLGIVMSVLLEGRRGNGIVPSIEQEAPEENEPPKATGPPTDIPHTGINAGRVRME